MPSGPFALLVRHFWLVCILVNGVNGFVWWRRAQPRIAERAELAPGYRRLVRGWIFWSSIPWLVMGIGILLGGVPDVTYFFSAKNGPFVIAWYVSLVAVQLLATWWIFARNGAEELVQHPGLFAKPIADAGAIKLFVLLAWVGIVIALTAFTFFDVAPPR